MGYAGHYDHFLERTSRIDDQQVDFAMSLYYDPDFVRTFLGYYDIPDDYERVAVAVDDSPDCRHIVLARDGGFVTCLGRGMSIRGLFRIPHEKIERHHALHGALRESQRYSEEQGWTMSQMQKFIGRKNLRLSRRDFERLGAVQPLLVDRPPGETTRVTAAAGASTSGVACDRRPKGAPKHLPCRCGVDMLWSSNNERIDDDTR